MTTTAFPTETCDAAPDVVSPDTLPLTTQLPASMAAMPVDYAPATYVAPTYPAQLPLATDNVGVPPRALGWLSRTIREYGYLTLQFLLCPFALLYFLLVPTLGAGLLVTVVGLFVVCGLVRGARGWAAMYRGLDRALLDSDVTTPPPFVKAHGFWRSLGAALFDGTGWRALLYMFLTFPLALVGWILSTTWLAIGLGGLTYPLWWWFLPMQTMPDGTLHRGFSITANEWYWFAESPGRAVLLLVVGALFLAMWVPLTHAFASLFRLLGQGLLGATEGSIRVAQLRAQRAAMVSDADAVG